MTMTDQAPRASYSSADDDPTAFRLPETGNEPTEKIAVETAVPVEKSPTELLIEEVNRAYALRELDFAIAAETPVYAQMTLEHRLSTPIVMEAPTEPRAARLLAIGDEIHAIREAQLIELTQRPNEVANSRIDMLKRWIFRNNKTLSEENLRLFITSEEHAIAGSIYGAGEDAQKEYQVQYNRVQSLEHANETEDEWTVSHVSTGQVFRYTINPRGSYKSHEGKFYPFAPGEQDLFEDLTTIYLERAKSRRTTKSA